MSSNRLAVDIGGTFTDVVLELATGQRVTRKLLTTYDHPGNAVLAGIKDAITYAAIKPSEIDLIIHGTTLATNALIERRGANTALLTTEGHRDALEMAHEDRFEQYDINIDRPTPLVPRYLRLPITERMDRDGNILIPLDEQSVLRSIEVLEQHNVESVAIGYLHAYLNPAHEQRTAELLIENCPDLSISLASEVAPEIREFERLSTACANAYVRPLMAQYLSRLASELQTEGFSCPFLLMTSGGGLTTLETAVKFPIRLVESGPAGGAILAQHLAEELGMNRMLSFDMGGTTAKLCLIDDGKPLMSRSFEVDRVYRFKKGSGLPVRIPVIEMVEIGAGGGSIAQVDKLQRVQVGPESAGSEPGPAVYNRGGTRPTVTDADVELGKIVVDNFASGTFQLDDKACGTAIQKHIADPLAVDVKTAAYSISELVDENMSAAARTHAAEFGLDIGQRDIVAFGGAAPLHAARLGEKLGVKRIVIPLAAGVGSALGFLLAPIAYEVVRSRQQDLSNLDTALVNVLYTDMHNEASNVISLATDSDLQESRQAYMRYVGQGHEIAIQLPCDTVNESHGQIYRDAFEAVYKKLYGHIIAGVEVEVLSWTLTLAAPKPVIDSADWKVPQANTDSTNHQMLFEPQTTKSIYTPVYLRDQLEAGWQCIGPALITEDQTTTVVSAAYRATITPEGHILLTRREINSDLNRDSGND